MPNQVHYNNERDRDLMWLSKFCENFQTHLQDKQIDIMVVPHRLTSHRLPHSLSMLVLLFCSGFLSEVVEVASSGGMSLLQISRSYPFLGEEG